MPKYVYPAIFTPIRSRMYKVRFPDFDKCTTFGNDIRDAVDMASAVLTLYLSERENGNKSFPKPSIPPDLKLRPDELLANIEADTAEHPCNLARRRVNSHKMLIPPIRD